MTPSSDLIRYLVGVGFAFLVFGACFYGLVLYEFNLDDLKNGALISLMTLAANFVFADAVARNSSRRSQQSFDQGLQATPPSVNITPEPPADISITAPAGSGWDASDDQVKG